jgi:hypothetical protein
VSSTMSTRIGLGCEMGRIIPSAGYPSVGWPRAP